MTSATIHGTAGPSPTVKDNELEAGAATTQNFGPIKAICTHFNTFHIYASDRSRSVETNHYCIHLTVDVRAPCLQSKRYERCSKDYGLTGSAGEAIRHLRRSYQPSQIN